MSRAPRFDFTFNGKTLEDLGVRHLIDSIEFTEAIDKFDSVKMVINDGPALLRAPDLIKHGSVMQLSMGYVNEGIYPMTIVFLKGIEPNFANKKVTLHFGGYLKAFDVGKKNRVLQGRTVQEIVAEVVADYTVLEVGTIEGGDLTISDTTTQSSQTDLSLLEGIASQFGLKWKIEVGSAKGKWALSLYKLEYDKTLADNYLPIHAYPEKEYQADTKSLKLKSFVPKSNILGVSSRVEIRSNNPNQPVTVTTDNKVPNKNPAQVTGSEVVATIFGVVTNVQFMENVTDEEAAQIIGDQLLQEDELSFVVAQEAQLSEGIPNLRVGNVRRVVPHGISLFEKVFVGEYLITGTRHRISSREGYDTWATMAMNALTVPPPPVAGFGSGGGGVPVLIWIYPNGFMEGWYINFSSDGTPMLGAPITQTEIEGNSYWMSHVAPRVMVVPLTTLQGAGFTIMPSEESDVPNLAFSDRESITQVAIDWPPEYNTDVIGLLSMATPVHNPPTPPGVPDNYNDLSRNFYAGMSGEERESYGAAKAEQAYQAERALELARLAASGWVAPVGIREGIY